MLRANNQKVLCFGPCGAFSGRSKRVGPCVEHLHLIKPTSSVRHAHEHRTVAQVQPSHAVQCVDIRAHDRSVVGRRECCGVGESIRAARACELLDSSFIHQHKGIEIRIGVHSERQQFWALRTKGRGCLAKAGH